MRVVLYWKKTLAPLTNNLNGLVGTMFTHGFKLFN